MSYFALKAIVSGLLIAAISEIARRSPGFAALVASLPLVSILGMIWLCRGHLLVRPALAVDVPVGSLAFAVGKRVLAVAWDRLCGDDCVLSSASVACATLQSAIVAKAPGA
jgi:hypothetical protein